MTSITSVAQSSTRINQVIFAVLDVSWTMGLNSDNTSKVFCISSRSHTRTVVRECCKGDDASQWRSPKFDPAPRLNPVRGSHKNWQRWLRRGPLHLCKSSSQSAQGFCFRACVTLRAKLHTKRCCLFCVFPTRYSQGPWTDFDAKYANTRGSAQGCAFSGLTT